MRTATSTPTVLRAAWLFDGISETLTPDPTVILDGGTITAVGTSLAVPDRATVVDLDGATILPGLIDTHVHLAFDASDDPVGHLAERDDAAALAAMATAARLAARGGVTTVRDLGDRGYLSLGLRDAATAVPSLPTTVAAGPPITTPGGHCHYLGGGTSGVAGIRAAIGERAERGVDVIKIMASGGNLTPGSRPDLSQFGPDALRAAVEGRHIGTTCRSPRTRTEPRPSSTPWPPVWTGWSTSPSWPPTAWIRYPSTCSPPWPLATSRSA